MVTGPGLMGVVEQRGCASILGRFRCLCTIDDRGNCGLFRVMRCGCKQFSKWRELFIHSFILNIYIVPVPLQYHQWRMLFFQQ